MKKKVYNHGGAKYNFDINEQGKMVLVSITIFGKDFEFPNGGITEKSVEEISKTIKEDITSANDNGEIDRLNEIRDFLKGFPEGTTLEEILESLEDSQVFHLTDSEIESWFKNNKDDGSGDDGGNDDGPTDPPTGD